MYNFDSLSLKKIFIDNYDFLKNASVQKIQQPSRREFIFNLRSSGVSKKLYVNINPKYPHLCFVSEDTIQKRRLSVPKMPPMFCMQLRKYLEGSRIKEITLPDYERILEFHFEVFDECGQLVNLCLAVELMGKYSNIILYDFRSKIILGSAHNVSFEKSSVREIYGGIKYIYPPRQIKTDILKTSFAAFCEKIKNSNDLIRTVSCEYYYFSNPLVKKILSISNDEQELFKNLQSTAALENNILNSLWGDDEDFNKNIDNYFSNIIFNDITEAQKASYTRILKNEIKKYSKILNSPVDEDKVEKYKQKGDLILTYIYLVKSGEEEFSTPCGTVIELDKTLSPSQNAQKYYKLYSKAKGAFEYAQKKKEQAKSLSDYYETILFNLANSKTYQELDEIEQELFECSLLKINEKKKDLKINLATFNFEGYEIYLGKNNKQNDYLISKASNPKDLWFHAYNCPSSHVLLKIKNDQKYPKAEVLEYCARLVKENSPLKNSTKASIIYTERKNLKKPPGGVLGYVIYKNEKEIVI